MNDTLNTRFKLYQHLLVECAAVSNFNVMKWNITRSDGNVRIRATLIDSGLLEIAEYVALDDNDQITEHSYTFHWQDSQHQRIQRWDNVDHYPELPYAPHHIHWMDETITGNSEIPTLDSILRIIEQRIA